MKAIVWVGDAAAAVIERTREGTEFRYLDDYSDRPVATTLPLSTDPVRLPPGQLPPFFAGLLPEGRRLSALKRSVKTSADDDLGLLLAVGANTVGNVSVLPEGEQLEVSESGIDLGNGDLDFASVLAESGIVDPQALAGVQEKASARTIAIPVGSDAIVKISPPEYPQLVENEFTCLEAYATMPGMKGRVVKPAILHDVHGRSGLVVPRFEGQFPEKLPVEDAAQLLGIYPADKYNVSYEEVSEAVLSIVAAPAFAAREIARQLAFAWLSGNGDLHAKNVSVINKGRGYELAPVYDIPSTVPYGDHTLALEVAGSRDGLSRRKFLAFSESLGLTEKVANKVAEQVLAATANLAQQLIDACSYDPRRVRDLSRMLRNRRQHWEV